MAKSFKELGRKAKELIEQGKDADQRVQTFQAGVAAAVRQVSTARRQLASVSETDENGIPIGDVEQARVQLNIAENQLAASRRALSGAKSDAARIREEKNVHVHEIEKHNRIERENLEKLRKLAEGPFSANAISLTRGMAERFNEAEDTRVALLKSMGIDAEADHVPINGMMGADLGWKSGGFGPLDLNGSAVSIRGGEGSFSAPGLINANSSSFIADTDNSGLPQERGILTALSAIAQRHQSTESLIMLGEDDNAFRNGYLSDNSTISEQIAMLKSLREQVINESALACAKAEAAGISEAVKVRKLSDRDRYDMGKRYIDNMIEVYRDNLRDQGISDGDAMEVALASQKEELLLLLEKDLAEGTCKLYDHDIPDFYGLAEQVRGLYSKYPPQFRMNDYDRKQIREGIRNGTLTEKEICSIGKNLSEHFNALLKERNAEWDMIRQSQLSLAVAFKNAGTQEEREQIELQRKVLMDREKAYHQKYNNTAMMSEVLKCYRPIGPRSESVPQQYQNGSLIGSSKVIQALENVRNVIPTDWVDKGNERPVVAKYVSRGYFCTGNGVDYIALSGSEQHMESCAFHEMGHRFESLYPEILKIEQQFYDRRTNGEQLIHLGPGYGKDEYSRFDHFIDPYMGKDYGGNGFELLSMGMEAAFCGTYNLAMDTDYQNFIFGILAAI